MATRRWSVSSWGEVGNTETADAQHVSDAVVAQPMARRQGVLVCPFLHRRLGGELGPRLVNTQATSNQP